MTNLHAGHGAWGTNDGSLFSTLRAWGLPPTDFLESLEGWGYKIIIRDDEDLPAWFVLAQALAPSRAPDAQTQERARHVLRRLEQLGFKIVPV